MAMVASRWGYYLAGIQLWKLRRLKFVGSSVDRTWEKGFLTLKNDRFPPEAGSACAIGILPAWAETREAWLSGATEMNGVEPASTGTAPPPPPPCPVSSGDPPGPGRVWR